MLTKMDRCHQCFDQPFREQMSLFSGRMRHQHSELISAHAEQLILPAHHLPHPLRHFLQQQIAGGMSETVIDQLETIKIHQQHAQWCSQLASLHHFADLFFHTAPVA